MNDFGYPFRAAVRTLRRSPLFVLAAVATLALGIAAVTAVFSVVDAVLIRPLSFREPDQLVAVWEAVERDSGTEQWRVDGVTYSTWRDATNVFDSLSAFGAFSGALTGVGEPRLVHGAQVTVDYFHTLGVAPEIGRFFVAGEDAPSTRVAVLGHGLWRERFGGSPDVVGRTLTLSDVSYTVIGVAPDGLYPSWPANGPRMHFRREYQDVWVPLPQTRLTSRRSHVLGVVGRLAPGWTPATAEAALDRLADPGSSFDGAGVGPLVDEAVGETRPALRLLLGAAMLVLIAAVANAGGLVVARALDRRHELALHRALGAGVRTLVRRQLAEASILGGGAALVGSVLARGLLPVFTSWVPLDVPRLDEATVDLRALAVTVAAAIVSSCACALAPLALARRAAPADALREGGRSGNPGAERRRASQLLVVTQIALAVALAITAALFVESFQRLESTPVGVATENLLVVDFELSPQRYDRRERLESFYREVLARVEARPEVLAAHWAYDHPLETHWIDAFRLPGHESDDDAQRTAELRFVTPGAMSDLGVSLHAGREFVPGDRRGGQPVALVNRAFARRYFGTVEPIGSTLQTAVATYTWGSNEPTEFEIVGVVGDVATPGIQHTVEPAYYLDVWQVPMYELKLMVRTAASPELLLPTIRAAVAEVDPNQPLGRVRTLERERRRAVAQPRFTMQLLTVFGTTAMALATIGVYGLLAGWVAGRKREIGLRAALGAGRADQLRLVLRRGLGLAFAGIAAGASAALAVGRLLAGQLYGIAPTEPRAFLVATALVLVTSLLACLAPALRATRIDPARVLREG